MPHGLNVKDVTVFLQSLSNAEEVTSGVASSCFKVEPADLHSNIYLCL